MTDEHEHAMKVWREADRAGEDAYVEAVETGTTAVEAHEAGNQAAAAVIAEAMAANAAKLAERDREIEALRGDVGRRDILIAEMIGKAAISVSLGGGEMWSRFNDEAIQGRAALGSAGDE